MPRVSFQLTFTSPAFLYGAYQRDSAAPAQPELRAQSVRGQLRYWLRALLGAQKLSGSLWEAESEIFGSTGQGAAVGVRLFTTQALRVDQKVPMLPHREGSGRPPSPARAIATGQRATLELFTRPGVVLPSRAVDAMAAWSLLGGIGKRSRRMFGAPQLLPAEDVPSWYERPASTDALATTIRQTLTRATAPLATMRDIPFFPTLHPQHSWVVVGREPFDNPLELNRDLFNNLLRDKNQPFRASEDTFGYARGGRRASPLIAQVRRIDGAYYPVLTALRSQPNQRMNWTLMRDFMKAAESHYNGVTAWGGW